MPHFENVREMHAKHYLYENEVYNSLCLLTFQFLFLSHCLLLGHLHLLVGLVLNYVAFVSCE